MTEHDPLDALLLSAFAAHLWLLQRLCRILTIDGDERSAQIVLAHKAHAAKCAHMAAERAARVPMLTGPPAPDPDPISWLDVGLSALLLGLVTAHARPPDAPGPKRNTGYERVSQGFQDECCSALVQAARENGETIRRRIVNLTLPIAFLDENLLRRLFTGLHDRLPYRVMLEEALATLGLHGLPNEPLLYLRPQFERFGLSRLQQLGIKLKLGIKLL